MDLRFKGILLVSPYMDGTYLILMEWLVDHFGAQQVESSQSIPLESKNNIGLRKDKYTYSICLHVVEIVVTSR